MSLDLLDRTRRMNRVLSEQVKDQIDFDDLCQTISNDLKSNVILISFKGKILGLCNDAETPVLDGVKKLHYGSYASPELSGRLRNTLSTKENLNLMTLGFSKEEIEGYQSMLVPIRMAGSGLGSLFLYRLDEQYSIDEIILAEYSAMVIALAIQRAQREEYSRLQQKQEELDNVIHILTKLELRAMLLVLGELDGATKGTLVASSLANRFGITRSVIVNAMKKCEGVGVIRTKSAGLKGTQVCVLNDLFTAKMIEQNMN